MLAKVKTASLIGVYGYPVTVEVDIRRGMPAFNVVGLADTTIREAFRRIRPGITNSGYEFPGEKITVNLVPAGKPKEGSHFDLPMALGLVMAETQSNVMDDTAFFGEMSLDGNVNRIKGALPLAMSIRKEGIKRIVVPAENAEEVAILKDMTVIPVTSFDDAMTFILNPDKFEPYSCRQVANGEENDLDFKEVVGHEIIKRALVIAVAGNHGVLLMGSPGCGKTMMAQRIPTIMPELTYEEQLEITGVYSVAGLLSETRPIITQRPFRSPHHTISAIGLTGGGTGKIKPGELSLAHGGVLFLDELGEFDNRAIDAMRQPLEEGIVRVSRNAEEIIFPSRSQIVVASNPCKCGNLWDTKKVCTCTAKQLEAHQRKLAGPFADRIDMHIKVSPVPVSTVRDHEAGEDSKSMREQVEMCREIQAHRFKDTGYRFNGTLDEKGIDKFCHMNKEAEDMLNRAYESMDMSMRAYKKVIKLALTIADLAGSEIICEEHVAEAIMYRVN